MSDQFGNITISEKPERKPAPKRPQKAPKKIKKKAPKKEKPQKEKREIRLDRIILFSSISLSVLLTIYALIGFFLIPGLLKKSLIEELNSSTGLEVVINRTSFNPFTFRTQFSDILVTEPENDTNQPPLLQLDRFDINLEITEILRSRLVCSHLNVENFTLAITRDKTKKYNFSKFIDEKNYSQDPGLIEFSKLPFLFSFNNIIVKHGEIIFDDQFSSKIHRIEQVNLSLPTIANFNRLVSGSVQPHFSAVINGSPIELRSDSTQPMGTETDDSQTKLSCDISSLDLPLYFGYLPASMPISLKKGRADGTLQISFTLNEKKGKRLTIDYNIRASEIDLQTVDKTLSIQTPKVELKGAIQPFTGNLHFRELFIHEPIINVTQNFSRHSFARIIPGSRSSKTPSISSLRKKELSVDTLLLDNGTINIGSERQPQVWKSLMFSLNNYTSNTEDASENTPGGSFSASGEMPEKTSTFSWKGMIAPTGKMSGDLHLTSLPAESFFTVIGVKTAQATEGACNIKGIFSLAKGLEKSSPPIFTLKNGDISINKLNLVHGNSDWLNAPTIRFEGFSIDKTVDFGNVFVRNGELKVNTGDLPTFITSFSKENRYSIRGIDFTGNLLLTGKNGAEPLKLSELRFQTNKLDQPSNNAENFGLSGVIAKKGELKAQGLFSLRPLQGTFELSFSRLPLSPIASFYTDKRQFLQTQALIRGQGKLNVPEWSYEGTFGIDQTQFGSPSNEFNLSWSQGTINDFSIKKSPFQIKIVDTAISNLKINENGHQWFKAKTFQSDRIRQENGRVHLGKINIKNGAVTLTQDRFPEIIDSWVSQKSSLFRLKSITYSGSLTIKPAESKDEALELNQLNITATDLEKFSGTGNNFKISAQLKEAGSFNGKGSISLTPLQTSLACDFSDIQSKYIFPWITDEKILLESQAVFSGKGKVSYPRNQFSGFLKVSDARIKKNPDTLLLGWRTADIFNINIEFDPVRISTPKVNVNQPGFGWTKDSSTTNPYRQARLFLEDILSQGIKTTKNGSKGATLDIGKINIKDGTVQYFDKRMNPPWQSDFTGINGSLETIRTGNPDTETKFNLSGSLIGSPVTVLGSTKLFASKTEGHSLFKVTTLPVSLFDAQIRQQIDIDPSMGTLDLVMNSKWIGGEKSGSAHFTFTSLTASSSDAETAVPLALLSDPKNMSVLYVPLDGNEQQPPQPLLNETVNVFQTKLIKAQYSPLLLAEHHYSDLANMDRIPCVPGRETIAETGRKIMARYSELAKSHPKLILKIVGMADPVNDGKILKKELEAKELSRVEEENRRRQILRKKREEELLRQKQNTAKEKKTGFTESNIPLNKPDDLNPISPRRVVVSDELLNQLAAKRAQEVYKQFIDSNTLTPDQLLISEEVQISRDIRESGNQVIIQLAARP